MDLLSEATTTIDAITLHLVQVRAVRSFSFGTWTSRQHVFICIESGGCQGWGENIISVNQPDVDISSWLAVLTRLKGLSIFDALALTRSNIGIWRDRLTEAIEMALYDLGGKCLGVSALSLLALEGTASVNGATVILTDNVAVVEQEIRDAVQKNVAQVVKVKLFGDVALDRSIIEVVRIYAPRRTTLLLGDVNCGYSRHEFDATLESITTAMANLHDAGLDACEDPASLTIEGWIELQRRCPDLALIPDYPLRPSRLAQKILRPGMGTYYNIHPGSAASVLDAIALARTIKSFGGRLMIGDDSLIGPGCTIWQQIAIGLGADWVEAVEKCGDSDAYRSAIVSIATESTKNPISMNHLAHGFGIVLDGRAIDRMAERTIHI